MALIFVVAVNKFYAKANASVSNLLHALNRLAAQRSRLITFDRADFASLLDSGMSVLGASIISNYQSPADISAAIQNHLGRTVLAEVDLNKGKRAACIFVASEKILDVCPNSVFAAGYTMLDRMLATGNVVHRGIYQGTDDSLQCITMVAGLEPPMKRIYALAEKAHTEASDIASYLGVDDSV